MILAAGVFSVSLITLVTLLSPESTALSKIGKAFPTVGTTPGAIAPDFRLPPLQPVHSGRLSSYRDKVVILTFWASWCVPCRTELPQLETLTRKYRSEGLEVIGVSIDHQGALATKPFTESFDIQFPILHDTTSQVANWYQVRGVPTTFVIDRQGHIVQKHIGYIDWNASDKVLAIQQILNESPTQSS